MGTDAKPAITARNSFRNKAVKTDEENRKLTNYLLRNAHNTPIEFNELHFYMKMPIFVARQLVRHRTASINEVSLRYVEAANEFYIPEFDRCQRQSVSNKQGSSEELVDDPTYVRSIIQNSGNRDYANYQKLLEIGLAKELARTVLPLGTFTEWHWKCDLHNTFHMLGLRLDSHAQYEIRVYAEAVYTLVKEEWPMIVEEWEKCRRQ